MKKILIWILFFVCMHVLGVAQCKHTELLVGAWRIVNPVFIEAKINQTQVMDSLKILITQTTITFIDDTIAKIASPIDELNFGRCRYSIALGGRIYFNKQPNEFLWIDPIRENEHLKWQLDDVFSFQLERIEN